MYQTEKKQAVIPGAEKIRPDYYAVFQGKLSALQNMPGVKILNDRDGITLVHSWLIDGKVVLPDGIANHPAVLQIGRGGKSMGSPLKPRFFMTAVEKSGRTFAGMRWVTLPCNLDGSAPSGSVLAQFKHGNGKPVAYFNLTESVTIMNVAEEESNGLYMEHVSIVKFVIDQNTGEVAQEVVADNVKIFANSNEYGKDFAEKIAGYLLPAFDTALTILGAVDAKNLGAQWVKPLVCKDEKQATTPAPIADHAPDAPAPAEEPALAPASKAEVKGGKGKKAAKQPAADSNNGHTDTVPAPNEVVA